MWEVLRIRSKNRGASKSPERSPKVTTAAYKSVNFKDAKITEQESDEEGGEEEEEVANAEWQASHDSTNKLDIMKQMKRTSFKRKIIEKNKLVIIMVGLPGRGKTFLCNKLKHYLNWLGHNTKHINVGNYRRLQKQASQRQDADFFDKNNLDGMEARAKALHAALDDLFEYLDTGVGQIAILDATNTTEERRRFLISKFHLRYQYLFIESICNDQEVLEQNCRFKYLYSPDYKDAHQDEEEALRDFKTRIAKYEEVYEPINDRNLHYIKLIDMVTGRGYMDVNRISGYMEGKIVFFLMQVCKAGMATSHARRIWLTRHGQSEWNTLGKLGGDSLLSEKGMEYSERLPDVLLERAPNNPEDSKPIPVAIWTSTLKRTIQTAQHLPFPKLRWKALDEINAGVCEGLTYEQVEEAYPEEFQARKKDKLRYRYPSGESYLDVIQRLEAVIMEIERENACVCIVGHQAILRTIYGYFLGIPQNDIPRLDIPLHTLMELQPNLDGTMTPVFIPIGPMVDDDEGGAKKSTAAAGKDSSVKQPTAAFKAEIQFNTLNSFAWTGGKGTKQSDDLDYAASLEPLPDEPLDGERPGGVAVAVKKREDIGGGFGSLVASFDAKMLKVGKKGDE